MSSKRFLHLLCALLIPTCFLWACGKPDCGTGTVERDGKCLPAANLCEQGQVWLDGECVTVDPGCDLGEANVAGECIPVGEICDPDEVWDGEACVDPGCDLGEANVAGECIPVGEICDPDEVWDGTACVVPVEVACGSGTALVGNECLPEDDICPAGQAWVGGACIDIVTCGAGTLLEPTTDECTPVDPFDTFDYDEAAEPNDLYLLGVPGTPFGLGNVDESLILRGTIDSPTVGVPDFDSWVFDGTAGQRILIEATALGIPAVAFVVSHYADTGSVDFQRLVFPYAGRNSAREVVLPLDGMWEILVGDRANVAEIFGLYDRFHDWDGSGDFTYLVSVTRVANPVPTTLTTGDFQQTVNLAAVPQVLVDVAAGTVLEIGIASDNVDVDPVYWTATADHGDFFGDRISGSHVVPAGGLLVTADLFMAAALDTGGTLVSTVVPVQAINPIAGTETLTGEEIHASGTNLYRLTAASDFVLTVVLDNVDDDADLEIGIVDAQGSDLASTNTELIYMALEAGSYFIAVRDGGNYWDVDTFNYDLVVGSFAISSVGGGELSDANTQISEIGIDTMGSIGDSGFYSFRSTDLGDFWTSVRPGANIDVRVMFFDQPVLAEGFDGPDPDYLYDRLFDEMGLGGDEIYDYFTGAPTSYYLRLQTVDVATPLSTLVDIVVDIDVSSYADWIAETEPNDSDGEANILGALDTTPAEFTSSTGWGELALSQSGATCDFWELSIDVPASVFVETGRTGAVTDPHLILVDSNGSVVDHDAGYARLDVNLVPGTYYAIVETEWGFGSGEMSAGGFYYLEAGVTAVYSTCPPGARQCSADNTAIEECNAGGTAFGTAFDMVVSCPTSCWGGACVVLDEVEPNDTADAAQEVSSGIISDGITTIAGEVEDRGELRDFDWYTFTLSDPAEVWIRTQPGAGDAIADTKLWLYEVTSGGPPQELEELFNNDDDDVDFDSYSMIPCPVYSCYPTVHDFPMYLPAGQYHVRAASSDASTPTGELIAATGTYELEIDINYVTCLPGTRTCNGDNLEICAADGSTYDVIVPCAVGCTVDACDGVAESETGDTPADAIDLNSPGASAVYLELGYTPVSGSIEERDSDFEERDTDWYSFEIEVDSLVEIYQILAPEDLDTRTWLYTDDGCVDYSDYDCTGADDCLAMNDGTPEDRIDELSLPAGRYSIRIEYWHSTSYDFGTYGFVILASAAP